MHTLSTNQWLTTLSKTQLLIVIHFESVECESFVLVHCESCDWFNVLPQRGQILPGMQGAGNTQVANALCAALCERARLRACSLCWTSHVWQEILPVDAAAGEETSRLVREIFGEFDLWQWGEGAHSVDSDFTSLLPFTPQLGKCVFLGVFFSPSDFTAQKIKKKKSIELFWRNRSRDLTFY